MSRMKTRNDDIERKIESHISSVVDMVKVIGAQSIGDLKNAKNEEINKTDSFKENIVKEEVKKTGGNQWYDIQMSWCSTRHFIFQAILKSNDLEKLKKLPTRPNYKVIEFHPEKINKLIQKELSDIVKTTENRVKIYKRTDKEN